MSDYLSNISRRLTGQAQLLRPEAPLFWEAAPARTMRVPAGEVRSGPASMGGEGTVPGIDDVGAAISNEREGSKRNSARRRLVSETAPEEGRTVPHPPAMPGKPSTHDEAEGEAGAETNPTVAATPGQLVPPERSRDRTRRVHDASPSNSGSETWLTASGPDRFSPAESESSEGHPPAFLNEKENDDTGLRQEGSSRRLTDSGPAKAGPYATPRRLVPPAFPEQDALHATIGTKTVSIVPKENDELFDGDTGTNAVPIGRRRTRMGDRSMPEVGATRVAARDGSIEKAGTPEQRQEYEAGGDDRGGNRKGEPSRRRVLVPNHESVNGNGEGRMQTPRPVVPGERERRSPRRETINVTIGRIEVRSIQERPVPATQPAQTPRPSKMPVPPMSLDEYLKQYNGRKR